MTNHTVDFLEIEGIANKREGDGDQETANFLRLASLLMQKHDNLIDARARFVSAWKDLVEARARITALEAEKIENDREAEEMRRLLEKQRRPLPQKRTQG